MSTPRLEGPLPVVFAVDNSPSTPPRDGLLPIVGAQQYDSTGSESWRTYLSAPDLLDAWSPPSESPYKKFTKSTTISAIDSLAERIVPRYSAEDEKSRRELQALITNPLFDEQTAVVLDSGGSHSVAMAAKLAVDTGRQPVILFDEDPSTDNSVVQGLQAAQETATLLYYADKIAQLKKTGRITAASPPTFVLDCHRPDGTLQLPTANELNQQGISKVVYLNEGDQAGRIEPWYQSVDRLPDDLKATVEEWSDGGLEVIYTGIRPSQPESVESKRESYRMPKIGRYVFSD